MIFILFTNFKNVSKMLFIIILIIILCTIISTILPNETVQTFEISDLNFKNNTKQNHIKEGVIGEAAVYIEPVQEELNIDGYINELAVIKPILGTITSRFGNRSLGNHKGLDIAANTGTDILACGKGTVTFSGWQEGYGNVIYISHGNGIETRYGHCSKLYSINGQNVEAGDVIAAVGSTGRSTGPHLHFEIRINGEAVNPQDYLYK